MVNVEVADRPVFIIGSPRSGTSVMQLALRRHPELWGGPESDYLVPLAKAVREAHEFGSRRDRFHWLSRQEVTVEELMAHVGWGLNSLYTSRSGGRRWVEQTPSYTLALDDIDAMFPDALFLWMLRDGREVVHSLAHFAANHQDLATASETWRRYTAAASTFASSAGPAKVLVVRFADLSEDPNGMFETVHEFIGAKSHPGPAAFVRGKRVNSSFEPGAAGDEARSGWRDWSSDDLATFGSIAGPLMDDLFSGWRG